MTIFQYECQVEVETTGWLGLGFSHNGRMKGSDMVMVWMKGDGRIHLDDRHSTGHRIPIIDQSQDYHLIEGQQVDMTTRESLPNTCISLTNQNSPISVACQTCQQQF